VATLLLDYHYVRMMFSPGSLYINRKTLKYSLHNFKDETIKPDPAEFMLMSPKLGMNKFCVGSGVHAAFYPMGNRGSFPGS
jgi:hypothetical protein